MNPRSLSSGSSKSVGDDRIWRPGNRPIVGQSRIPCSGEKFPDGPIQFPVRLRKNSLLSEGMSGKPVTPLRSVP
jgi:hypothetical protein